MVVVLVKYKYEDLHQYNDDFVGFNEDDYESFFSSAITDIEAQGHEVKVIYFAPVNYFKWLGDNDDTRNKRSEWGAIQTPFRRQ